VWGEGACHISKTSICTLYQKQSKLLSKVQEVMQHGNSALKMANTNVMYEILINLSARYPCFEEEWYHQEQVTRRTTAMLTHSPIKPLYFMGIQLSFMKPVFPAKGGKPCWDKRQKLNMETSIIHLAQITI
jgi:hypothetical protein